LFGIGGVNGGLANNTNPCIGGELHWARDTPRRSARRSHPPVAHSYRRVAALDPVGAKTAPWWLDVELAASWAP
jgi:hypothetical protein